MGRNVRKGAIDKIKKMKKGLGEDVAKDFEEEVQSLIKKYEGEVVELVSQREAEIMSLRRGDHDGLARARMQWTKERARLHRGPYEPLDGVPLALWLWVYACVPMRLCDSESMHVYLCG